MSEELKFVTKMDDSAIGRAFRSMNDSAHGFAKNLQKNMDESNASLKRLGGALSAVGAGFAVAKLGQAFGAITDRVDTIVDLSSALSLTTEEFQRLSGVFELSGVASEKFAAGITKLNGAMEDARQGNAKAIENFTRLGVTMSQMKTATTGEMLLAVSDGLATATNRAEAMAAASDLIGVKNLRMIGALEQGSAAIIAQGEKIRVTSESNLAAIDRLGDAFTMLKNSALGAGAEGLGGFLKFADRSKGALEFIGKAALLASPAVARLAADLQKINAEPPPAIRRAFEDVDVIPGLNASGIPGKPFSDTEKDSALDRAVKSIGDERATAEGKAIADALDQQARAAQTLAGHLQRAAETRRDMAVDLMTEQQKLNFLERERVQILAKATKAAGLERAELIEKLALKDQEIQKQRTLMANARMDILKEKMETATERFKGLSDQYTEFGLMGPTGRREEMRRQHDLDREKARTERMKSGRGTEARAFMPSQKDLRLSADDINELAKAIARENAKLIPQ